MKKTIFLLILTFSIIISCIPVYAMAEEYETITPCTEEVVTDEESSTRAISYSATIMQGNTNSASDCNIFYQKLRDSGRGYSTFDAFGWTKGSDTPNRNRVTEDELTGMAWYTVAYYSGHGKWRTNSVTGELNPVINYTAGSYSGNFNEINVAEAFGVDSDDWRTSCTIRGGYPLQVLILASCSQLDTNVMKYYARIMRSSNIHAIAGYHDTAPSYGDDDIAAEFIDLSSEGNSVWYSWENANTNKNWALLLYQDNNNQYYRLPGFPSPIYAEPATNAYVFRYANFLDTAQFVLGVVSNSPDEQIENLPLSLTTREIQTRSAVYGTERETVNDSSSVVDSDIEVRNYIKENVAEDALNDTLCVQHYVSCTAIDEEQGLLADTETIIARTYDYYDTYAGVKIADSYIGASIDCEGIKNVSDKRQVVIAEGDSISQIRENSSRSINLISKEVAIEIARTEDTCCDEYEPLGVSLAYAPTANGEHVLCYEVVSSHGFCYVNVETGEIINWL